MAAGNFATVEYICAYFPNKEHLSAKKRDCLVNDYNGLKSRNLHLLIFLQGTSGIIRVTDELSLITYHK